MVILTTAAANIISTDQ